MLQSTIPEGKGTLSLMTWRLILVYVWLSCIANRSAVTNEEFHAFFEQFGPVLDCIVLVDRNTNRSRGFGFVTFESPETSRKVLSCGSTDGSTTQPQSARLEMRGKLIEIKLAVPKESSRRLGRPYRVNHGPNAMPGVAPYPYMMYGDQSSEGFAAPPTYYPAPGAVFAGYMAPMYYHPDMLEHNHSMEGPSPSAFAFFPSPPPLGYMPQAQGQAILPYQQFNGAQFNGAQAFPQMPPQGMNAQDDLAGGAH